MARFAGTRVAPISIGRGNARSAGVGGFEPQIMNPGNTFSGAAANAVSTGDIFGELRAKSPKYDEIANTAQKLRAEEQIVGMQAEATMASAGIQAAAEVAAAEETAKGLEAQASAAKTGGMMSAVGGIASAAIGLLSDETTKQNIASIDDALATLRELHPVSFQYTEEFSTSPERVHHGFIAQEFQKVLPDATYFDSELNKLCIDTSDVIGLLVRANQQLESRLTRLEAKQALAAV